VPGADHPLLVAVTTVMMGDIGEEITEIELEPLPEEIPTEEPVEPVPEPAPG
jgi:4-diphosphocytidyl-2C-methyl-D-erythritol kinase